MSQTASNQALPWQSQSGAQCIDRINWSAPPHISVAAIDGCKIQSVHHHGTKTDESVFLSSTGAEDQWDCLLVGQVGSPTEVRVAGELHKVRNSRKSVFFVPCGVETEWAISARAASTSVWIPNGMLQAASPGDELVPIIGEPDPQLANMIEFFEAELKTPGFGSQVLLETLLSGITMLLGRHDGVKPSAAKAPPPLPMIKLRRVKDYVESRLDQPIGLADLARVAGLSVHHFAHSFKQAAGMAPYQYVQHRRLERAKLWIAREDLSLAQLALECGFASQSHFTTAFTRAMMMPPGQYRRQVRGV